MERSELELPEAELVIELDAPISRKGGGTVESLTLREPQAGQVRAAESHLRNGLTPQAVRDYNAALITTVSGVSREVIDQLPITKFIEASDYLQRFISPARLGETTGA